MIDLDTGRGWWVAALWIAGAIVLAILTVTTGGLVLGAILLGLVLLALWIGIGRLWDRLRHGKPVIRRQRHRRGD